MKYQDQAHPQQLDLIQFSSEQSIHAGIHEESPLPSLLEPARAPVSSVSLPQNDTSSVQPTSINSYSQAKELLLTQMQALKLVFVNYHGESGLSQRSAAQLANIPLHQISDRIGKLEKQGYIYECGTLQQRNYKPNGKLYFVPVKAYKRTAPDEERTTIRL